jgi:hypothetical protein
VGKLKTVFGFQFSVFGKKTTFKDGPRAQSVCAQLFLRKSGPEHQAHSRISEDLTSEQRWKFEEIVLLKNLTTEN